ncbi:MAG TPA: alkaline phosphatase D family protein, partial [Armatimonadota bacterium]|nr:alkaline phosphatase D family protein [Armatimonadota bacterium]
MYRAIVAAVGLIGSTAVAQPYQASGVKVGEVTARSAIVWTRLTSVPERLNDGVELVKAGWREPQWPEGVTVDELEGACPGAEGEVRVVYGSRGRERATAWETVDADGDFTAQFRLRKLRPNTEHAYRVECRSPEGEPGRALEGGFRTAPPAKRADRVVFTVVTGQGYWRQDTPEGHGIYREMLAMEPSFFVNTGDIVYYDRPKPITQTVGAARYHWQRTYSLPLQMAFHRRVASYFLKDDHDTLWDDAYPTMDQPRAKGFTFADGQRIFREQVPMGKSTYRTVRWGRDLQIWMVEGRDFRSPNTMEDGPDKTIWGEKQKAWLKRTVLASDATFKLLISPTPIVGPDRTNKRDNHANPNWTHEGGEIREWIRDEAPELIVVCGDRHWQYVSVHPETGVREFSCGATSDAHSGGFGEAVPEYHRYFNVVGGFLSGTVERDAGAPTLTFRHHTVSGDVLHEERIT